MWKYLKKYLLFALLAPLFMVGEVAMDLVQPGFMSTIVDEGVLGLSNSGVGDLSIILSTGLKMIGCVVIGGSCGVLSGVFAHLCAQNFGNDIRKDVFRRIMSLSFEQTDQFSTGSLVTRTTNDITQIQNMVQQCIRGFIRQLVFMVGGIYCMVSMDISFGVIAICAFPFLIVCIVYFLSKVTPFFGVLQEKLDRVNSVMQENVAGARVVKAYVREDYEKTRFGNANKELVDTQLHILLMLSYMTPIMNIVLNIAVVAVIYVGSIRVQTAGVTPGNVMAAITYLSYILNGVMSLAMMFQNVSRGMASYRRVREVLDSEPVIADGRFTSAGEAQGSEKGRVELRHVSFAYPGGSGEKVLSDVSLMIEPGETVALLGATGSGKTSLVSLIPRFYDATEGEVFVDGVNVKNYKVSDLRDKIAIALQKSELFSKSIRENIRWGNPGATDEEVLAAAEAAQATEFIFSKPEGLDTLVAEKGMSLSGGQKQRLSISRALLKNAEILILDDSTSALDLKTEARLYEAMRTTYKHVTKIIIAQRIASVRSADRIAVIDNGQIVACAPHEELMKHCKIYQDIYSSQLREGGDLYGE
ncbi:MAG: ABC transporter ATP-binding protein/permease [Lachnospiraceae bacterium]|nr:ABC transporter ATP-binding protein/permease [Lachnospiraceae bacterium]